MRRLQSELGVDEQRYAQIGLCLHNLDQGIFIGFQSFASLKIIFSMSEYSTHKLSRIAYLMMPLF